MFESINTKFPLLTCTSCGARIPLETKCRVHVDVSGWLLYAKHVECYAKDSHAPVV